MQRTTVETLLDGVSGRVAVVTGAARGIGAVYASALAAVGATVVVSDVLAEEGVTTAKAITADGGIAEFIGADIADRGSVEKLMEQTVANFGGVDILVNNAALWGGLMPSPITDIPEDRWDRVFDVNVKGMWLASVVAAEVMKRGGRGVIINQSSIGAYLAGEFMADYSVSKAAVNTLTKTLAKGLAPHGIRVNAIAPGGIATEATLEKATDEQFDGTVARQCIKRRGQPEDLIGPLLFLAGDASAFMSGQVVVVDGGLEMRA